MNPHHIPHILEPYIRQCIQEANLTLLTSVLDTPTNWLLVRFLAAALSGTGPEDASGRTGDGNSRARQSANGYSVVLVSIWRSFELWTELASKCRLNLHDALANGKLCYVNGLGGSSPPAPSPPATTPARIVNMKSLTLQELNAAVTAALQGFSVQEKMDVIVVLDGLDFLLACQPDVQAQAVELAHFITDVRCRTHAVVVTCAADSALLHGADTATATPLEREHSVYVRTLAHQAGFVLQLRPLETGHSREVSGTVRVSKGGSYEYVGDGSGDLIEAEWLYLVKGDGAVSVWERGGIR